MGTSLNSWHEHVHSSIQLRCIGHLKQCAVSSPSISKTLANPLMWNQTYWKCNEVLTAKQLILLPFPSNFSFHTFKSRTCSGIKGSQSRSSGFSLPPCQTPCSPSTVHIVQRLPAAAAAALFSSASLLSRATLFMNVTCHWLTKAHV